MTCNHCKMAVERIIRGEGIEHFEVDLSTGKVWVESDKSTTEKLISDINETGIYTAKSASL